MNGSELKKEYNNIADDIELIVQKSMVTRSEEKIVDILSSVDKVTTGAYNFVSVI